MTESRVEMVVMVTDRASSALKMLHHLEDDNHNYMKGIVRTEQ